MDGNLEFLGVIFIGIIGSVLILLTIILIGEVINSKHSIINKLNSIVFLVLTITAIVFVCIFANTNFGSTMAINNCTISASIFDGEHIINEKVGKNEYIKEK